MYLSDLHVHSRCSPDGKYPISDMAAAGAAAGLSELCVTDHCDLLDLNGHLVPDFDWAPLEAEFARAAPQKGMKLRFGLELGEAPENFLTAEKIISNPKLDFIIGSLHNLSSILGGKDYFYIEYTSKELCYRYLDDYITQMEKLAGLNCYDVLGHIVYPLRYMCNRDGQDVNLDCYQDRLREILRTAASRNKGIEFNTNRGRSMEEWLPILRLFRECGGEIITVGSDAHQPQDVGKGIREAYELLQQAGFRYVCVFEKRKPIFIPLNG